MKLDISAAFALPAMDEVANLMTQRIGETALKPDSPVVCINRGRTVLHDMFDGNPVALQPGYFRTEYGAALHFQRRQIVKGTRNLELGGFVSWIGILGSDDGRVKVDSVEHCEPFTDDELTRFGEKIEGIDRTSFADPADRDVTVLRTSQARAAVGGQGSRLRPDIDARAQATEGARDAAGEVFAPPDASDTRDAEAEAGADTGAPVRTRRR